MLDAARLLLVLAVAPLRSCGIINTVPSILTIGSLYDGRHDSDSASVSFVVSVGLI